jgi:hypothetical protein
MPNFLNVLSLLIGLAGLSASIYFYRRATRIRDPIFIVDSSRIQILSSKQVSEVPIKVLKKGDAEVRSDLTGVRFYFWNQGTSPIKRHDILEPIQIRLDDSSAEIIDAKLLKMSRDVTKLKLDTVEDDPIRTLGLTFEILESGDGTTGQIIYEGNPNAVFKISGIIEGVKSITTEANPMKTFLKGSWVVILTMITVAGTGIFFEIWMHRLMFEDTVITIARNAMRLLVLIFLGWSLLILRSLRINTKNATQLVPENVLPDNEPTAVVVKDKSHE